MKTRLIHGIASSLAITFVLACHQAYALDEGVLTPTHGQVVQSEEQEFRAAMSVWNSHRYADGEKLLREFAKKHPKSRWAAEAKLHCGCNLYYEKRYDEARKLFKDVLAEHPKGHVAIKAKIRLGNVAEKTGSLKEAVSQYAEVLRMNPTWDQFRYANYRARILGRKQRVRQALINCGPVALAACMEALGKPMQAETARTLDPGEDGMSLARLAEEAQALGTQAQAVEMSVEDLKAADKPIIVYLRPNHFAAVLSLEGDKIRLEDSIRGKHETALGDLEDDWLGRALVFCASSDLKPLSAVQAEETLGGCCGNAEEDECLGSCSPDCAQEFDPSCPGSGSGMGSGGCSGPGCNQFLSTGRPSWKVNTINLNLIVEDTPIWYDAGLGPKVGFTLTYSNENSNTGIFGPGWRCPYDMRVFFLPPQGEHPTLQIHRDTGRIETWVWFGSGYVPGGGYGYRDSVEELPDGTILLTLRGGGKYYFKGEGGAAEGRIWKIEDITGKQVICEYDVGTGNLVRVKDANNRVTDITTTGTGLTERVTMITLPDGRHADFAYTADADQYLQSIADMGDHTSTFTYNALAWGNPNTPSTTLAQAVTADPPVPDNGESLNVGDASEFPKSGAIQVNGAEIMGYAGQNPDELGDWVYFTGIERGSPPLGAPQGAAVRLVSVPYLNTIETPSGKTKFEYQWWWKFGAPLPVVALHQVFECGPTEQYPTVPTLHYAWCSHYTPHYLDITRYPTAIIGTPEDGCADPEDHWTGGLTRRYLVDEGTFDATGGIVDELAHTTIAYAYNQARDRDSSKDAKGNETKFTYDANHNVLTRTDPSKNTWT